MALNLTFWCPFGMGIAIGTTMSWRSSAKSHSLIADAKAPFRTPTARGGGRSSGDEFQLHFTTSQGGWDLRCVDPEVESGTFYLNWWLYHVISSHTTHFLNSSSDVHEVHIWNPVDHVLRGDKLLVTWVLSAWISRPCPPTTSCQCPTLRDFELHQSICEHDDDDPSLMLDQNQSPIFSGKSPDLRTVVFAW